MDDLSQTIKQVLEEKGVLCELKARIRAEIFESLQLGKEMGVTDADDKQSQNGDKQPTPSGKLKWSKDEQIINELITEYMSFHGLQHSLSVFLSETNCKKSDKINVESQPDVERGVSGKEKEDRAHPILYDIVPLKP